MFGGRVGEKEKSTLTNTVLRGTFDKNQPGNIKWSKMAPTKDILEYMGAFHIGNRVYLLGGRNSRGPRKDIFRAEISSNGSLGIWVSPERYHALQAYWAGFKKSQSNDIKEAQKYFSKAVALDNTFWDGYLNIGSSYILMGQYNKAIAIMEGVLQRNPDFEDGYLLVAVAYDKKKDIDNALKYIELAIDNGVGDVLLFYNHPGFRNSKKDPRFEPLMKKKLEGRFIH
jgi:tetratricopeptide (TPR) repeat protein